MNIQEILLSGGGVLVVLMTLVQITPIKVNPWSAIGRAVGKVLNGDVIEKLDKVEHRLDKHIDEYGKRNADSCRTRILRFNTELLSNVRHTEEDFDDILYNIDCYERYCAEHPEYQNNKAVHAIKNIERVYDECMENHDFL